MPLMEFCSAPRWEEVIYLIVDCSAPGKNMPLAERNRRLEELLFIIQACSSHMADVDDVDVKIHVLAYSQNARWLTPEPISPMDFQWPELPAAGPGNLNAALDTLESHLRGNYPRKHRRSHIPTILFVGISWPAENFIPRLNKLQALTVYRNSTKIGIPFDEQFSPIMALLVGNSEAVLPYEYMAEFLPRILPMSYHRWLIRDDMPITEDDDQGWD